MGFAEMDSVAEAESTIKQLDGTQWRGRDLKINQAKPCEGRNSSDGGNRRDRFSSCY
ncbi:hypothetical protein VB834_21870 [Limnoraphis robusta Tam1]|uniref:RNA-binding protein n=1 Tax=Limnoraphis robusta CCNP1315 TaxID=3110306 RepID=A0ABU5U7V9_9CYAN|nr:hypothetical protein [Limnoraphis robusta]MEA5496643.1 hypothetical protein [Limnoraphis robusta BA-68 BA1]MEA5522942.1 hypothetical protein [Limnoraphis robusta CCNP1315]MEA5541680.1 hypothetical protein [Limnoraphis robusta Tam1]MEA5548664.1 hypothetical protein [Limnoraphis robusta CCNP1324]